MNKNPQTTEQKFSSKQVLKALQEMRSRLDAVNKAQTEPIAIVGMACRFPGGANDPSTYLNILHNGIDAITPVPPERWNVNAYYDSDPEVSGKAYTKEGGFIEQVDQFDPLFFGIAPKEAVILDPQYRLLLEVTWEALENAGQIWENLKNSQTSVFMGISTDDYSAVSLMNQNQIGNNTSVGNNRSVGVGRISHLLGLQGANIQVDTACSSSLVATHLACQNLRLGESNLALVGGVNLILSPISTIGRCQLKALSPDGRCKTFDAAANGYGQGEGCGVLVLKRLSDAISDGDSILALIRGSAVNHDGPSSGMTVPNKMAQKQVIQQALSNAKLEAHQISYLEAHGTGTSLGDPIEIEALAEVYGKNRPADDPLIVGSVKTNIGHLEAAAGVSSLMKVILALQHQEIPPHLHLKEPNPHVDWDKLPIKIPTSLMLWSDEGKPRIAGVSSFGMGGTNAHVIIEEALSQIKTQNVIERPIHLLTLSAKTEKALDELVSSYQNHLETNPKLVLAEVCYTASTGRAHFNYRLGVLASELTELTEKLLGWKTQKQLVGVFSGQPNSEEPKIAFLFTGQGSQYVNMGRQLYEQAPTFREALEECARILQPYLEVPLLEVIYPQDAQKSSSHLLDQTAYTQPALFAIEYALFKLWESWGVQPDVVMGHSVGEYVAATVAGALSLEDGLKLIATRGKLMQQLPSGGQMVSVMASESQVTEAIKEYTSQVTIAAINGPESTVISGESAAIAKICSVFEGAGIKTKQLQVSHAFHSPLMEPMLTEFEAVAKEISYNPPKIPLISNVTGTEVGTEICTAQYWVAHVRQPVRFAQSMKTLEEQGYETFLEIGPKPILLGMGRKCVTEEVGEWLPSLRPGLDEWQQMLSSLGQLYVKGVKIDWSGFDSDYSRQKVSLPTYPFQRERCWIETNPNVNFWPKQEFSTDPNFHPLLGQKLNCASEQHIFASQIGEKSPNYLSHHRIFNQVVFPTTGYLEMASAAGNQKFKTPHIVIEDLTISKGWTLPEGELINAQTILTALDNQSYQFQIFSQPQQKTEEQKWTLHATGKVRTAQTNITPSQVDLEKYKAECRQPIEVKEHYQQSRQFGLDYGSSFQGICELWSGENKALAQIKLPEELIAETIDYHFHPALLDAALQLIGHIWPEVESDKTYLTVGVEQFKVYSRPGLSLWAYASAIATGVEGQENMTTQVTLLSPEGEIIATVKGLQVKVANKQTLLGTEGESITNWLYEVEWRTKGLLGRLLPPDFLLAPVEVSQKLTPNLQELVTQIDNASTSEIQRKVEALSVDYIVQALLSMGWSYKPTESFNLEAAVQRLGIVPSQRRLFERLLQILAEVGILQPNQQQWEVQQTLERVDPTQKSQSLLNQYPEEVAGLTLLDRCASQLAIALRGAIDPVELVFPQGDLTTATQFYQESQVTKVMNTIVQKNITQAIEKLPPSRGIRLLEIGAGTGGTTSYILPHLNPNQTEYIFTDIGALFTTKAQEQFKDYRFISYQTLDIEVDPTSQGFTPHQYDVIIAANVLHATTNMKQTLSHVRQLLAPGGMLVLYETTTRSRFSDLIFGLLEGWWKFTDYDLRSDYPLLSRQQWKKVLSETGFTQVVTLPEVENMAEVFAQQGVIVAQAAPIPLESTSLTPKGWLILADQKGIAQQVASQLHEAGEVCTLVFAGEHYRQLAPEEFIINPHNPEEFEQLIEAVAAKSPSLSGVVQCWTTETGVGKNLSAEELENLSKLGCGTTLSLVQALVKVKLSRSPRLWLVTNGSQPVPSNNPVIPGVAQSSLWGMGKVIRLEYPDLKCVCIDLDPQQTIETQAEALFQEIWSEDTEDQVAWRAGERYAPRLVASRRQQTDATIQKPLCFHQNATYLITEGIGDVGLLVARWMVEKGAKHLVLLGCGSLDDANRQKITELERAGVSVVLEKADVSDVESMSRVLHKIEQSNRPLTGVIHSAELLSDDVLQHQSESSFKQVMASKVKGAWHLHQLTQNQQLDFFILFSSVASLLGSPGQGNQAVASGFLDGLAHYRRAMGLPGLSIHWGSFAQVEEVEEPGLEVNLQKQGMGVISPTQVLESLELLMSGSEIEVGVLPIQWSAWQERVAQWPFLADWQETNPTTSEVSQSEFLLKLKATAPNERRSLLVAHVHRQFALVLGINHPESISLETGFFDLGMDSLTSVELRNKLQTSLECSLPSSLAFDYPNLQALTDHLEETIILPLDEAGSQSETPLDKNQNHLELETSENMLAEINHLSEDEIDMAVEEAIGELDQLLQ
ncbi:MAG: SDR family NAD(P)-dependent oxidoreductase [Roseofilum sp. SBFL]|uniref:type I polyketide synthase n=1 Tax=unclassified Roseofilum TaxID=2620099 RepID=UPI001B17A961|nr:MULTISPECIES: type I polyketide synthase [unclassified Roseofilum]MBP0013905.1 SDR family NAD(P)-dependent oxidoreductase [Roseofilum sp. SID3]MBP0039589.1 SDR family NAD(P)-dependent oxidoreductase [Roseofilum sp. SID1]MBP0043064.1 SDR family NAD(P)-dependent oxidoreductase [Roseofilum sp. SBFL]